MSLGWTEIILIVLFILIVFGAKRIPELAKSLGRASYEFKKAKKDLSEESRDFLETAEKAAESEDAKKTAESEKAKEKQS